MAWWEGFWGWAVTAVLAGIAAVGVVVDMVSRRLASYVQFTVVELGTELRPDGERWSVFTLANAGTLRAYNVEASIVRAEQRHDGLKYAIPAVFSPGDRCMFAVAGDPTAAYIRILWFTGLRSVTVAWWPLNFGGELGRIRVEQTARIRRRWWRPWQRYRRGPVGPVEGGVAMVRVRARLRPVQHRIDEALSAE